MINLSEVIHPMNAGGPYEFRGERIEHGGHIILVHFAGLLPSHFGSLRLGYGVADDPAEFLDLKLREEDYKRPGQKSIITMMRSDAWLRRHYDSEDTALAVIDSAWKPCIAQGEQMLGVFSGNPKDYLKIYEVAAPIFNYLLQEEGYEISDLISG